MMDIPRSAIDRTPGAAALLCLLVFFGSTAESILARGATVSAIVVSRGVDQKIES